MITNLLKDAINDSHVNTITDLFEFVMCDFCENFCKYHSDNATDCDKDCPLMSI